MTSILQVFLLSIFASCLAQQFDLSAENVQELESFLHSLSDGLGNFAREKIPSRFDFGDGYCDSLKLIRYQPFNVKLRRLNGQSFELKIRNGLVEGEGYCKGCKKVLWVKICGKAKPLARIANLNFRTNVHLATANGKPVLRLSGGCHLDLHFKIVKMRGRNLGGKIAGLFKGKFSRMGERALEKFGCKQLDRAIAKANEKLCDFLSCYSTGHTERYLSMHSSRTTAGLPAVHGVRGRMQETIFSIY